eukprot:ANDGO_01230.mRNA.1 hypothetical protein
MSHLAYLNSSITPALTAALSAAAVDRPSDPVDFVGRFLLHFADIQDSENARAYINAMVTNYEMPEFTRKLQEEQNKAASSIQTPWRTQMNLIQAERQESASLIAAYESRKEFGTDPPFPEPQEQENAAPAAGADGGADAGPPAVSEEALRAKERESYPVQIKEVAYAHFVKPSAWSRLVAIRRKDLRKSGLPILQGLAYLLGASKKEISTYHAAAKAVSVRTSIENLPAALNTVASSAAGKLARPFAFRNAGRVLRDVDRTAVADLGLFAVVLFDAIVFLVALRREKVLENREKRAAGADNIELPATEDAPADVLEDGYETDPPEEVETDETTAADDQEEQPAE